MSEKLIPGHIDKAFRALFVAVKPELKHDFAVQSEDVWTALSGIYDADKTPESFIPSLAWSWGSFSDAAYFDQPLREYLKKSLYLIRRKGTLKTLETAIDMLPDTEDVTIVPWYKTEDVPAGYIVITMFYSKPFTPRIWNALKAVIDSFNRYSAHIYLRIEKRIESTLYVGGVVRVDRMIKLPVTKINLDIPEETYFLTDSDGNILTDADGNKLVYNPVETESFYLLDSDGNIFTDADGNKLIYNPVEVSSFLLDPDGNILTDADGNKLIYNPVEASSFLLDPDGNILIDNLGNNLFY